MATADEILATMAAEAEEALPEFVLDNELRVMEPPGEKFVLGVAGDADVNKVRFLLPRMYRDVDLSTFGAHVNYRNANGEKAVYDVQDATSDGDTITFTWLVGRHTLAYQGTVKFVVCMKEMNGETCVREFNSTVAQASVLEGLEMDEPSDDPFPDDPVPDDPIIPDNPDEPSNVTFSVGTDGKATLSGANLTVDANGNGTLTGATLTVDSNGNGTIS